MSDALDRAGRWLSEEEVIKRLERAVGNNQAEWARQHGISVAYVNDVLRRRRLPGEKIAEALDLQKILHWRARKKSRP